MDFVRYVEKVKREPMTLNEGYKVELINKDFDWAISAKNFLLRIGELLPGKVHPGVKEIHDKSEHAFYVLDGNGIILIDDESYELRPNTAVYVPAGASHQLKNTGDKLLKWIVLCAP